MIGLLDAILKENAKRKKEEKKNSKLIFLLGMSKCKKGRASALPFFYYSDYFSRSYELNFKAWKKFQILEKISDPADPRTFVLIPYCKSFALRKFK